MPMFVNPASFGGSNLYSVQPKGYLQVSAETRSGRALFVNALRTTKSGYPDISSKDKSDFIEIHDNEDEPNRIICVRKKRKGSYAREDIETDALIMTDLSDEGYKKILLCKATTLSLLEHTILSTDRSFDGTVSLKTGEIGLEYSSYRDLVLTVPLLKPPKEIILDGKVITDYNFIVSRKELSLTLPESGRTLTIKY